MSDVEASTFNGDVKQLVKFVPKNDESHVVSVKEVHRIHDPQDPVTLFNSIVQAKDSVRVTTNSKLAVIGKQMDFLVNEAKRIMAKCQRDERLHSVACNCQKKPGTTYHLYSRANGQQFFSLLSPEEWGPSNKFEHIGSYRLEADRSFTCVDGDTELEDPQERKYQAVIGSIGF